MVSFLRLAQALASTVGKWREHVLSDLAKMP